MTLAVIQDHWNSHYLTEHIGYAVILVVI